MKLTFCGGVGAVTGANFLLETGTTKLIIDCGLLQGTANADSFNRATFPYDPKTIQYLVVTHAHMDHIGRIPKLVKDGFRGEIVSTPQTMEIVRFMFDDALKILDEESRREGVLPLYEKGDVDLALSLWKPLPYHSSRALGEASVYFKDAGHILGSAMAEITAENKKIVFTGDLGNSPSPLLRDTEHLGTADYVVMESVYGDRNHETHEERHSKFKQTILDTIARKGVLLIPSFSLERTQVILYELNTFFEKEKVPQIPVFLDSPLASHVTSVYEHSRDVFNEKAQAEIRAGDDIFNFPKLKNTIRTEDSQAIHGTPNPKIIIAGSGMSSGGRVRQHEKTYLGDKNTTLLLVGYQAVGTLGRQLLDGTKEILIKGEKVKVHAKVDIVYGYSAHKDSDNLIKFIADMDPLPKKVFAVMGELKSSLFLVQRLRDYVGVDAVAPSEISSVEL
ncbi:MAG: MBL fold metallo-hydrolase [Candidatus Paceibacterota bacterium]|jgi:metallo-beta-lactamase family protein